LFRRLPCLYADGPKGVKITNAEMDSLAIEGNAFHPEWNYTIKPRNLD